MSDDLSALINEAWPDCPHCGRKLQDAGLDDAHPYWLCPSCSLGVVPHA